MSNLIGINVGLDWCFSVNSPTIALNKSDTIGPLLSSSDIFKDSLTAALLGCGFFCKLSTKF